MGFLSSIGNALTNPTMLMAIATMNPGIIAAALTKQIASQIGQQVIEAVGKELGLPQPMIDAAQGAFASSMGDTQGAQQNAREAAAGYQDMLTDFFESNNVRPVDRGNVERAASSLDDVIKSLANDYIEEMKAKKKEEGDKKPLASDAIEGGFLFELASLLGKVLDEKMGDMKTLATDMNDTDNKDRSTLGSLGAKIQAVGQEMKILSSALDNAIKSTGESQSTLARKG